jgi:hypothetical protein
MILNARVLCVEMQFASVIADGKKMPFAIAGLPILLKFQLAIHIADTSWCTFLQHIATYKTIVFDTSTSLVTFDH